MKEYNNFIERDLIPLVNFNFEHIKNKNNYQFNFNGIDYKIRKDSITKYEYVLFKMINNKPSYIDYDDMIYLYANMNLESHLIEEKIENIFNEVFV